MQNEEFIALLKSSINENGLNTIPGDDLIEIYKRAKLIEASSNNLDIELSKAINILLEEIKKRRLSPDTTPQKILDYKVSSQKLEQENIELRETIVNEKLKKAEELFTHRLVYTAIIFVILFIILGAAIDDAGSGVQWLCIIIFFAIVIFVVAKIFVAKEREEKDARN